MSASNNLLYDESGAFTALQKMMSDVIAPSPVLANATVEDSVPALPLADLNGSWYLQLTPVEPQDPNTWVEIRGPLRIEVAPPRMRVSGDIYVDQTPPSAGAVANPSPVPPSPQVIGQNWYPQLPFDQYAWYLRSRMVSYVDGVLTILFDRRTWNQAVTGLKPHERDFLPVDNLAGTLTLDCPASSANFTHPDLPFSPTIQLTGKLVVADHHYTVTATKTSPLYRGCAIQVDVMAGRTFPMNAETCQGVALDYKNVYREAAGLDIDLTIHPTPLPSSPDLTVTELEAALDLRRRPAPGAENQWLIWILVGSRQGDLFGLMFDDSPPFREGVAGFWDVRFSTGGLLTPAAQGKRLGQVPSAFLRTLVHETGHAFNLFHPKHDVHPVPIGTTIMNQTGDVMQFATAQNLFPCCITFLFDEHNRTSLIHSPDPQIAPGWMRFGWGHGSLSSGVAEPTDAMGLIRRSVPATDLQLSLSLPTTLFRGEFVMARFTLTNIGGAPREISSALNLSQGDLRLLVTPPGQVGIFDTRDVIVGCGDRATTMLNPGESLQGSAQVFYTNVGHTFRQTGRYYVSAEFHIGDGSGTFVRSNTEVVVVRAPLTEQEKAIADLTIDGESGVLIGRAFAFGDFWKDTAVRPLLETLADNYGETDTGRAAGLVLANALSRDVRDLRDETTILRAAEPGTAGDYFGRTSASLQDSPHSLVTMAVAVAAPTDGHAPVLNLTADYLNAGAQPAAGEADMADALADDAMAAPAADYADAEALLTDLRRTFPARQASDSSL